MGKMTASTETKTRVAVRTDLTAPPQYKVIFVNDNVTTVDFVMEILITLFDYAEEGAKSLTLRIHDEGMAVVAIMPYELAEQKALETTAIARSNSFPLNVKIEPAA
jgi:ATP-dependent Clp protease adaptor protein ClpS